MSLVLLMNGVLVLGLAVAVTIGVALRPTRTVGPITPSDAWVAASRHAGRVSASAWAALVTAPLLVAVLVVPALAGLTTGLVTGLLPAAGGAAFLAVHALGELTWPRPTGAVRRAALVPRRIRDVAPRRLSALVLGWSVALLALLATCAAVATDDGRGLSWRHGADVTSTSGPFPGWFYGRWLIPAVLLVLLGCVAVLRQVAGRPAVSDTSTEDDAALRRLSARRVLAGVQLVLGGTLAGCLGTASQALRGTQGGAVDGVALGDPVVVALALVGSLLSVAVAVTSVVVAARSSAQPRAVASAQRPFVGTAAQARTS